MIAMITQRFRISLLVLMLVPFFVFSQKKGFYFTDNSYHRIFKEQKVKSLKEYAKRFDKNGKLKKESLEAIRYFAKNGDLTREREYYGSGQNEYWEITSQYNAHHQMLRTEWISLEDKTKELSIYEYDSEQKLIKSCDYWKDALYKEYKLEGCETYHYKDGLIHKIKSFKGITTSTFKHDDKGFISKFNATNKLESKYENGELIYLRSRDNSAYKYERNSIGQILKSIKVDLEGNLLNEKIFEYQNGLLIKTVFKEKNGHIKYVERYVYEYYE